MAQYQNIFTQVQVEGPAYAGVPLRPGSSARETKTTFFYWLGKIGDAQIGPIYLGFTGVCSVLCGLVAIEIIGLNMLAQVDWSPIEFLRQFCWLALEPPKPEYGISIPPLKEGGWWLMAAYLGRDCIWIADCREARLNRHRRFLTSLYPQVDARRSSGGSRRGRPTHRLRETNVPLQPARALA